MLMQDLKLRISQIIKQSPKYNYELKTFYKSSKITLIQLWRTPILDKPTMNYQLILEYSSKDGENFKNNLEDRQGDLSFTDGD